jgi:Prohead core protein serine protease
MSDKHLLTEWLKFDYNADMIKESRDQNGGKIVMKGILQKSDTLNQNGRIYPHAILEREVRNYQKFIKENRALGECDHPDTSVVELKNASHIVREAYMEGKTCFGIVELLDTPSGKILQSLVESGVTLGISSRGVGSTKKVGDHDVVQDDFQLICWDFVSEPSTPNAFMMREGKDINKRGQGRHLNKTDRVDRIFNEILEWR